MNDAPAADDPKEPYLPELFRVGPGYISHWMHVATHHSKLDDKERTVVTAFGRALGDLLRHRNTVESARRAAIPVSKLDHRSKPSHEVQTALFDATKDFYLSYYSAVSAMASLVKRFPSVFANPPHNSNERFLEWMSGIALFAHRWDTLRAARHFRTLVDHPAGKQPYNWGTVTDDGVLRAILHGPAGATGNIPDGAEPLAESDSIHLRPGDGWTFIAPDEDEVLTVLAVQLNAIVHRIQAERYDPESLPCAWEPSYSAGDPEEGYVTYAIAAGTVVATGPMTPEISEEDRTQIDTILAPYLQALRADEPPRSD